MTVLAEPEDVEPVTVGLEALVIGESLDGRCHIALEGRGGGDVNYLAAVGAQEVVVVLGELLGQLVAGEFVIGGDAPHHPGDLQVDEVAIGGAAGQIGQAISDITDADGVPGVDQEADDGPPAGRVALVGATKSVFHDIVQITLRSCCSHRVLSLSGEKKRVQDRSNLVLVVVASMGSVAMPVMDVVDMPIVVDRLVPAVDTVLVAVVVMLDVGEGMLVVVAIVLIVGMAVVDVVEVPIVVDGCMSAVGAVGMAVVVVNRVVVHCHGISFTWCTASATMCATWWSISE